MRPAGGHNGPLVDRIYILILAIFIFAPLAVVALSDGEREALQAMEKSWPSLLRHQQSPWDPNVSKACDPTPFIGLSCSNSADPHIIGMYAPTQSSSSPIGCFPLRCLVSAPVFLPCIVHSDALQCHPKSTSMAPSRRRLPSFFGSKSCTLSIALDDLGSVHFGEESHSLTSGCWFGSLTIGQSRLRTLWDRCQAIWPILRR